MGADIDRCSIGIILSNDEYNILASKRDSLNSIVFRQEFLYLPQIVISLKTKEMGVCVNETLANSMLSIYSVH